MKIIYNFLLMALLVGSFTFIAKAEEANKVINKNAKKTNTSSLKTAGNLIFEDEFLQIYYKPNSVAPTSMMKMKFSEGPMYYFGKLIIVNKTDSELVVKANILDKLSKEETIAKVEKLQEKRLAYNEQYSGSFTLMGAVANGATKKLKNQYGGIINQIEQDFIEDDGITEIKLPAKEEALLEFGLKTYKQKPQIAISYKSNSQEPKFFFQEVIITDQESQKQILK